MTEKNSTTTTSAFFWIRHVLLIATSCFFLLFGIQVLVSAYQLKDPFTFILTFFASNFIILISGALLVGFVLRIRSAVKSRHNLPDRDLG
jgi:hypothetical protein